MAHSSNYVDLDYIRLIELHSKGMTDEQIAAAMSTSRVTILRRRRELGLKANRKVGERGPAIKDNEAYWLAARRCLKYIGKHIQAAARKYYSQTGDWQRFYICMLMEPRPMFHPVPGPYASDPEKMHLKHVKYITDFERQMEMTAIAGCPGPEILELAQKYKTADKETIERLAMEAVKGAGYVNLWSKVMDVVACMSPETILKYWEQEEADAMAWAPNKEWKPVKKLTRIRKQTYSRKGNTGKKGKGGGTQDIDASRAYLGAMGY